MLIFTHTPKKKKIALVPQQLACVQKPVKSESRFLLSKYTTEKEIDYVLKKLPKVIEKLRRLSPLIN